MSNPLRESIEHEAMVLDFVAKCLAIIQDEGPPDERYYDLAEEVATEMLKRVKEVE